MERIVLDDSSFFWVSSLILNFPPSVSYEPSSIVFVLPSSQGNSTPRHPKGHRIPILAPFWNLTKAITFGSGRLLMEAVLCLELLVLRWGRMSYGLEDGVTWGQFKLLNNENRLPNSLPRKENWVFIFFSRQYNSVLWTWIWANSRRKWRTGKPGVLQSMGLQRVRYKLVTQEEEQQPQSLPISLILLQMDTITLAWSVSDITYHVR